MQNAMIDLLRRNRVTLTRRDESVALTQQPQKVRSASIDFIQTDIEGSTAFSVLLRYTPTKINIDQLDVPSSTAFL